MMNLELQDEILDLADKGYLLLVESRKLVHQLQYRCRSRRSSGGRIAWTAPDIVTLNDWTEQFWANLWPESWPASSLRRWRILEECMRELPPPEPLDTELPLILAIDESFRHCLLYGLDPGAGDPANQLIEWRRELWPLFSDRLREEGVFHPASLPERIFSILSERPSLAPGKLAITGFEYSSYFSHWEGKLLKLLSRQSDSQWRQLPFETVEPRSLAFSDPEQEIYWILEDLTSAATHFPLHELAIVILDPNAYHPLVEKYFNDIFGPPLVGEKSAYNLFPNRRLSEHPLFLAARLPLDFAIAGEPRLDFLALLRSAYYGFLARRSRKLSQWDWLWRKQEIDAGLRRMLESLPETSKDILPQRAEEIILCLAPFLDAQPRWGSQWASAFRFLWKAMEFPVIANEADQLAWLRLDDVINKFEAELGSCRMTRDEVAVWLNAVAETIYLERTGMEEAGIQIIGMLDARGLAYRRVYIPGMVSGALPQPVRPLPFLSPMERKRILGGTAESQSEFGKRLCGNYLAAASEVVFSRPVINMSGDAVLPSPFWHEEREQLVGSIIPWRHSKAAALQRARWVSEGIHGLSHGLVEERFDAQRERDRLVAFEVEAASRDHPYLPGGEESGGASGGQVATVPEELPVSSLGILLSCHSRYFFEKVLQVEPLPEIRRGIDPSARGRKVHEIAALFAHRLSLLKHQEISADLLSRLLNETVRVVLGSLADLSPWSVEIRRLIGSGSDESGLLLDWVRMELTRLQAGWRWVASEASFSGLRLEGCPIPLRGRLDRVDFHPEKGFVCWDYKTGYMPSGKKMWEEMSDPQLPVYLLAIRKGLVPGIDTRRGPLSAGYIDLRSARRLKHDCCISCSESLESLLVRFEEGISIALNRLASGELSPKWVSGECEESACSYECLCGSPLART